MNPTSDHVDIAGYLVEMLTPKAKQRADAHIRTCADCRTEIESMQRWSAALRAVPDLMMLESPQQRNDLLLQPTLRPARVDQVAKRRRRSALQAAVVAVAVTAAVAGGVLIGRGTAPMAVPRVRPSVAVATGLRSATAVGGAGAKITATVTPSGGWIRVSATVGGIPAGQPCRLEVVGRDGTVVVAGSWLMSAAGAADGMMLDGSALIDPASVASVRVVDPTGQQFVNAVI